MKRLVASVARRIIEMNERRYDLDHAHLEFSERLDQHARLHTQAREDLGTRLSAVESALQIQRRQSLRTAELVDLAVELLPAAAQANPDEYARIALANAPSRSTAHRSDP